MAEGGARIGPGTCGYGLGMVVMADVQFPKEGYQHYPEHMPPCWLHLLTLLLARCGGMTMWCMGVYGSVSGSPGQYSLRLSPESPLSAQPLQICRHTASSSEWH